MRSFNDAQIASQVFLIILIIGDELIRQLAAIEHWASPVTRYQRVTADFSLGEMGPRIAVLFLTMTGDANDNSSPNTVRDIRVRKKYS